jgi:hypothetical protein
VIHRVTRPMSGAAGDCRPLGVVSPGAKEPRGGWCKIFGAVCRSGRISFV